MSLNADHYIELQKESVRFLVWLYFMDFIYYSGAYTEIPKYIYIHPYIYPHWNWREFGLLSWLADLLSKQNSLSITSVYLYFSYCIHMTSNYALLYFYFKKISTIYCSIKKDANMKYLCRFYFSKEHTVFCIHYLSISSRVLTLEKTHLDKTKDKRV